MEEVVTDYKVFSMVSHMETTKNPRTTSVRLAGKRAGILLCTSRIRI
jgi:hypothetical protein